MESEIHLIEWLLEQNFPAMKPHPMKDGKLSREIDTPWGALNISCFEMVSGETLEDCDGTLELVYGYGKILGLLHKKLMDYPFAPERKDYLEFMEEIHERLIRYHAPENVINEFFRVKDALSMLPTGKECYGVVHYDFEPDNVLYDKETGAFGVIDFDDAIRCWYSLDIVRAIDALDDVADNIASEVAEIEFLKGYRSEKTLSDVQIQSFSLMRRLVQLQSYATILYVLSDDIQEMPNWMQGIIDKLKLKRKMIEERINANN